MDWRELQEEARMQRTRLVVREEISAVLEDIRGELTDRMALGLESDAAPIVFQFIDTVQTKIKERGTDGTT